MNTRSMIGMCGLLAATGLAGCAASDVTAPKLEPGPGAAVADDYAGSGRNGLSITYTVDNNVLDHYWFSANQDSYGKVSGGFLLWEIRAYDTSSWAAVGVLGRVVCITASGNKARIGGVVTYSTFSGIPVGTPMTWSVTDNGAKGSSSDDTASALFAGIDPIAYCAGGLPYPEQPVTQGGLKVVQ